MDSPDLSDLRSLVRRGRVIADRDLLVSWETPERGDRGVAAFAVEPDDPAELSAVTRWAYESRAKLVIQGANTGLVGASTPDATGTQGILRLDRMSRIVDFSPTDRAIVVEAGLSLAALNEAVASEGLFFPVEVGSNPTVGGLVATNAGGARTLRYGDVSRNVLSVEAVLADAEGSTVGKVSNLEKDNSRLGVARLFIGSFGTLGVVSRVALRLEVKPTETVTGLLALDSYPAALVCLGILEKSFPASLSAFELISGDALRMTLTNVAGLSRPFATVDHEAYVLVEVIAHGFGNGGAGDLELSLAREIDRLGDSIADAVIAPPAELWRLRHSLSEGVRSAGATIRFDISVPRASLPAVQARLQSEVGDPGGEPMITQFGHWGDGGTHLQLVFSGGLLPEETGAIRQRVYDIVVREFDGSFSAEHGLGPYNSEYYQRYVPDSERRLEQKLKTLLDPHGVWGRPPYSPVGS